MCVCKITTKIQGKFAGVSVGAAQEIWRGLRRKEARCMKRTFSGVSVGMRQEMCRGLSRKEVRRKFAGVSVEGKKEAVA